MATHEKPAELYFNEYEPQPKQRELHTSPANEILFGGAAGPGKSHAIRHEAAVWCSRIPGLQVYLFRRTNPELEKTHIIKTQKEFPADIGSFVVGKKRWDWFNGSMLHFCHCQYEKDVFNFQGAEIHLLCVGAGTPVLMADGTYKAIERLRAGDMAMTLRGPRRVTKTFEPRKAACVEVTTPFGKQVNPADHKVLCESGWASYDSLSAEPTQSHAQRKSASQDSDLCGGSQATADSRNSGQSHSAGRSQSCLIRRFAWL